jgi:hypothetical protein
VQTAGKSNPTRERFAVIAAKGALTGATSEQTRRIIVEINMTAHHSKNYVQTVVRLEGIAASWAATGTRFVLTGATAALMHATSGVTGATQRRDNEKQNSEARSQEPEE